jgi:hypothetical protein
MLSSLSNGASYFAQQFKPSNETKIHMLEKIRGFTARHQSKVNTVGVTVVAHEILKSAFVLNEQLNICFKTGFDPFGFYNDTKCSNIIGYPNPVHFFVARLFMISAAFLVAGIFYEANEYTTIELDTLRNESNNE